MLTKGGRTWPTARTSKLSICQVSLHQILLLSGPPGYGKTTLAHIVARHAGYRTLEINASDDRSAATVTNRIKNAIDAGSGLGAEGRPTCVIVDEIDGASGGGDTVGRSVE